MISFERIDPNILKQVRDQTLQEIVHTTKESAITRREEKSPKTFIPSKSKIKKKVKKFNGILKENKINIYLDIEDFEEEAEEKEFFLRVFERDSKELIQVYFQEEVEEMLMKLESFIGFFIDDRI